MPIELKKVVVLGSGTMGKGIAQWLAQNKVRVELADARFSVAQDGHKDIMISWEKLQQKGKFTKEQIEDFADHLFPIETSDCQPDTDLLIEAIFENLEIKKQVFKELDQSLHESCLFASNTSSFPISELAQAVSPARQEKFLGLHFFNPATIMKLVEVVKGEQTNSKLVEDLAAWFGARGKEAAICQDGPGFIVNRVARNFYGEALRVVNPHQKNFAAVDEIMKEVGGFKMGPFELMDLIGVDVNFDVTQSVWKSFFHEARFSPHPLQAQMVRAGRLGRKTRKGFYDYE